MVLVVGRQAGTTATNRPRPLLSPRPLGAGPPYARRTLPSPEVAETIGDLSSLIDELPATLGGVAGEAGVAEAILALQVDRNLDARIWAGTQVTDRVQHTMRIVGRDLYGEIEKSLLAQESFDEFEARMMRRMGIGALEKDTGGAAMRAIELEMDTETRLAWNDGIEAANQQEDTITVWAAEMDDVTTQGCWDSHGFTFEELGARPPRHFRCRCGPKIVPNPDSNDPEWARLGQDIIEEMAAERESGEGLQESVRAFKPSRLFREAA